MDLYTVCPVKDVNVLNSFINVENKHGGKSLLFARFFLAVTFCIKIDFYPKI